MERCDLDWGSRLRWLPSPRYSDAPFPHIKDLRFLQMTQLLKALPQANMATQAKWSFYPSLGQGWTCHAGKRSLLGAGSQKQSSERTLEAAIGRKKQVELISQSAPGSRPYLSPEYSPDFHTPTFRSWDCGADTFIPLQPPLNKTCVPYAEKCRLQEREAEILEVKRLDRWKPAPVIFTAVLEGCDLKV